MAKRTHLRIQHGLRVRDMKQELNRVGQFSRGCSPSAQMPAGISLSRYGIGRRSPPQPEISVRLITGMASIAELPASRVSARMLQAMRPYFS